MSLIATLLHKPVPPIHHSAQKFLVEQYRDKPRFEREAAMLHPARPAFVPKCYDHMLNKKVANRMAIEDCLRNGIDTQMAIHLATNLSQATVCVRLSEMVSAKEAEVDRNYHPLKYSLAGETKS